MMTSKTIFAAALLALALVANGPARALPVLQLFIEGATYDTETETWLLERTVGDPLRVWAIGNVAGPGNAGPISNVRMSFVYPKDAIELGGVSVALGSSTTGGFGGFVDPSTPQDAVFQQLVADGSRPLLSDGSPLPPHGEFDANGGDDIYNALREWQEFLLGDFTLTDSPVADFINSFPDAPLVTEGQINVYEIDVSGLAAGAFVHIDLYDNVGAENHAIFAPFSHDAGNTTNPPGSPPPPIPEPASLSLFAAGLLALGYWAWRRRRMV